MFSPNGSGARQVKYLLEGELARVVGVANLSRGFLDMTSKLSITRTGEG